MSKLKDSYNSQELTGVIALDLGLSKDTTNKVISSFFKNLLKIIKDDGRVKIDGFGTFDANIRRSKKKPPSVTIKFIPSVVSQRELNEGKGLKC